MSVLNWLRVTSLHSLLQRNGSLEGQQLGTFSLNSTSRGQTVEKNLFNKVSFIYTAQYHVPQIHLSLYSIRHPLSLDPLWLQPLRVRARYVCGPVCASNVLLLHLRLILHPDSSRTF